MGRRRRGGSLLSATGAKGETRVEEPTAAERLVARRAAESRATVPTLELSVPAPARSPATTAQLVRACALALQNHPRANAAYRDGHFELYSRVNVGVVIATTEAYLIPTIFDAAEREVGVLEEELAGLVADAAGGRLTASAFSGATFTVWNAAESGLAGASMPVVPPQAGALGAGSSVLTLACDHRILYGARAAAFLKAIADHLERLGV